MAEGWRRCPLSCQPGQALAVRAAGTRRDQATFLTEQGVGVSWKGLPQSSRHPSAKVAQREGHIPVSAISGMWLPRWMTGGGAFLGDGGWGRGPLSRDRKTLQTLGRD